MYSLEILIAIDINLNNQFWKYFLVKTKRALQNYLRFKINLIHLYSKHKQRFCIY